MVVETVVVVVDDVELVVLVVVLVVVVVEDDVVVVCPVTSQSMTAKRSSKSAGLAVLVICNCKTSFGPITVLAATPKSKLVLAAKAAVRATGAVKMLRPVVPAEAALINLTSSVQKLLLSATKATETKIDIWSIRVSAGARNISRFTPPLAWESNGTVFVRFLSAGVEKLKAGLYDRKFLFCKGDMDNPFK